MIPSCSNYNNKNTNTHQKTDNKQGSQQIDDITNNLLSRVYKPTQKLSQTLQGEIWKGKFNNKNIVIKRTNKLLHSSNLTIINGKKIKIYENICSEMEILKYLTLNLKNNNSIYLNNMVQYIDFVHDINNYYLIMSYGGTSLFDFVLKGHRCVSSSKLSIYEWINTSKILFKQMCSFISVLHNVYNVCHLDISLENMLINDVLITVDPLNNDSISFIPDFLVKFCDFGLAAKFDRKTNPQCLCNKFVGKTNYKSPEIYKKQSNFNAKLSDVWSLGVCLFATLVGSMPFNKPSKSDITYQWIMNGQLLQLLNSWNKLQYINNHALDILTKIFKKESKRIDINQLLTHEWLK